MVALTLDERLEDDADDNILSSNACGYKLDPFTLSKLVVKSELDAESGALPSPSRWATLRSKMYLLCSKKSMGTPPATRSGRRASLVDLIDADHPRSRSLVTSTSARRAATPGCPRTSMPAARRPCGGSFAATRTSLVSRPSLVPVGSIWAEPHAAADKESDPVAVEPPPYSIDESFSPPKSIEELAPGPHTALDAMRRVDEAARNGPRRGPSSVWSQPLVAGVLPSAAGEGKEQDFETGPAVAADEDTASDGQRRPTRPRKPHMTPLEAPEDGMPDFGADAELSALSGADILCSSAEPYGQLEAWHTFAPGMAPAMALAPGMAPMAQHHFLPMGAMPPQPQLSPPLSPPTVPGVLAGADGGAEVLAAELAKQVVMLQAQAQAQAAQAAQQQAAQMQQMMMQQHMLQQQQAQMAQMWMTHGMQMPHGWAAPPMQPQPNSPLGHMPPPPGQWGVVPPMPPANPVVGRPVSPAGAPGATGAGHHRPGSPSAVAAAAAALSTNRVPWGQLLDLATDARGSRVLQDALGRLSKSQLARASEELAPHLLLMARHPFGNYVASTLAGFEHMHGLMASAFSGELRALLCNPQGSRVVQALLGAMPAAAARDLVAELDDGSLRVVADVARDTHGSWGVIAAFDKTRAPFILASICEHVVPLATQQNGCRVVQAVLKAAAQGGMDIGAAVSGLIAGGLEHLATHSFANYAVQVALRHASAPQREAMANELLPRLLALSASKHGSNVAESVLSLAQQPQLDQMCETVFGPLGAPAVPPGDALRGLMEHPFGNYVLQTLVRRVAEPRRRADAIDKLRAATAPSNYGRSILARLGAE